MNLVTIGIPSDCAAEILRLLTFKILERNGMTARSNEARLDIVLHSNSDSEVVAFLGLVIGGEDGPPELEEFVCAVHLDTPASELSLMRDLQRVMNDLGSEGGHRSRRKSHQPYSPKGERNAQEGAKFEDPEPRFLDMDGPF